jgi:hypothetical protein
VETQRQWSDLAIQRTTPILLGVFSIVTWITFQGTQNQAVPIQKTAWYKSLSLNRCLSPADDGTGEV